MRTSSFHAFLVSLLLARLGVVQIVQAVRVLERRLNRLIGRFCLEAGISYVVPDDRRIQRNVQVPPDERLGAQSGQLVVVELIESPDEHGPQRTPIGRLVTMAEVVKACRFLLENEAINGLNLNVDGGWMCM